MLSIEMRHDILEESKVPYQGQEQRKFGQRMKRFRNGSGRK